MSLFHYGNEITNTCSHNFLGEHMCSIFEPTLSLESIQSQSQTMELIKMYEMCVVHSEIVELMCGCFSHISEVRMFEWQSTAHTLCACMIRMQPACIRTSRLFTSHRSSIPTTIYRVRGIRAIAWGNVSHSHPANDGYTHTNWSWRWLLCYIIV